MPYEEDFEKWAQHFQSMDRHRWERAQRHAMRRARQERTDAFFQAITWSIDRIKKIAIRAKQPRPAMGKPFRPPYGAAHS